MYYTPGDTKMKQNKENNKIILIGTWLSLRVLLYLYYFKKLSAVVHFLLPEINKLVYSVKHVYSNINQHN